MLALKSRSPVEKNTTLLVFTLGDTLGTPGKNMKGSRDMHNMMSVCSLAAHLPTRHHWKPGTSLTQHVAVSSDSISRPVGW
ncbi:hypothetical protein BDR04DRAFT_1095290 [Suillus decipiens]|nr:hypothetical protein BDR04DRAFT_1095290 [Suillus decipiens]